MEEDNQLLHSYGTLEQPKDFNKKASGLSDSPSIVPSVSQNEPEKNNEQIDYVSLAQSGADKGYEKAQVDTQNSWAFKPILHQDVYKFNASTNPITRAFLGDYTARYNKYLPGSDNETLNAKEQSGLSVGLNMLGGMLFNFGEAYSGAIAANGQMISAAANGDFSKLWDSEFTENQAKDLATASDYFAIYHDATKPSGLAAYIPFAAGSGEKYGHIIQSLGFTGGMLAYVATENAALAYATGGMGNLARAPKTIKGIYDAFKYLARADDVYSGVSVAKKMTDLAKFVKVSATATVAEQTVEGAMAANEFQNEEIAKYKELYGVEPDEKEIKRIANQREKVGNTTFALGAPVVYASNLFALGSFMKTGRFFDMPGNVLTGKTIREGVRAELKKGIATNARKVLKTGWDQLGSQAVEEIAQSIASESAKRHYSLYQSDSAASFADMVKTVATGDFIKTQSDVTGEMYRSGRMLDDAMSGMIIGGITMGIGVINDKFKSGAKESDEDVLNTYNTTISENIKNAIEGIGSRRMPGTVFGLAGLPTAIKAQSGMEIMNAEAGKTIAKEEKDKKEFHDQHSDAIKSILYTTKVTGMSDVTKEIMNESIQAMPNDEYAAQNMTGTPTESEIQAHKDKRKAEYSKLQDEFDKDFDAIDFKYGNPINKLTNPNEWQSWEEVKRDIAFYKQDYRDAANRAGSLNKSISAGINKFYEETGIKIEEKDIDILVSQAAREKEIANIEEEEKTLKAQLSALDGTIHTEQQKEIREKLEKLEDRKTSIQKLSVITMASEMMDKNDNDLKKSYQLGVNEWLRKVTGKEFGAENPLMQDISDLLVLESEGKFLLSLHNALMSNGALMKQYHKRYSTAARRAQKEGLEKLQEQYREENGQEKPEAKKERLLEDDFSPEQIAEMQKALGVENLYEVEKETIQKEIDKLYGTPDDNAELISNLETLKNGAYIAPKPILDEEARNEAEAKLEASKKEKEAIEKAIENDKDDISDEEYKDFVDSNTVSQERLNSLYEKVKNNEKLSTREIAIMQANLKPIEELLAKSFGETNTSNQSENDGGNSVGGDVEAKRADIVNKLFEKKILSQFNNGNNWALDGDGRIFIVANINGNKVLFYTSSEGTSGKNKGSWYPVIGISNFGYIIKGSLDAREDKYNFNEGYGIKEIKDFQNFLNENLNNVQGRPIIELENIFGDKVETNVGWKLNKEFDLDFLTNTTTEKGAKYQVLPAKNDLGLSREEAIDIWLKRFKLKETKRNISEELKALEKSQVNDVENLTKEEEVIVKPTSLKEVSIGDKITYEGEKYFVTSKNKEGNLNLQLIGGKMIASDITIEEIENWKKNENLASQKVSQYGNILSPSEMRIARKLLGRAFPNIIEMTDDEVFKAMNGLKLPIGMMLNGKMWINSERETLETRMHELGGHVFFLAMKNQYPSLYERLMGQLTDSIDNKSSKELNEVVKFVKELYPELSVGSSQFNEEVMATYMGQIMRDGVAKAIKSKGIKSDIAYWLNYIYERLMNLLGIENYLSMDKFANNTLGENLVHVGKGILNGRVRSDISTDELATMMSASPTYMKGIANELEELKKAIDILPAINEQNIKEKIVVRKNKSTEDWDKEKDGNFSFLSLYDMGVSVDEVMVSAKDYDKDNHIVKTLADLSEDKPDPRDIVQVFYSNGLGNILSDQELNTLNQLGIKAFDSSVSESYGRGRIFFYRTSPSDIPIKKVLEDVAKLSFSNKRGIHKLSKNGKEILSTSDLAQKVNKEALLKVKSGEEIAVSMDFDNKWNQGLLERAMKGEKLGVKDYETVVLTYKNQDGEILSYMRALNGAFDKKETNNEAKDRVEKLRKYANETLEATVREKKLVTSRMQSLQRELNLSSTTEERRTSIQSLINEAYEKSSAKDFLPLDLFSMPAIGTQAIYNENLDEWMPISEFLEKRKALGDEDFQLAFFKKNKDGEWKYFDKNDNELDIYVDGFDRKQAVYLVSPNYQRRAYFNTEEDREQYSSFEEFQSLDPSIISTRLNPETPYLDVRLKIDLGISPQINRTTSSLEETALNENNEISQEQEDKGNDVEKNRQIIDDVKTSSDDVMEGAPQSIVELTQQDEEFIYDMIPLYYGLEPNSDMYRAQRIMVEEMNDGLRSTGVFLTEAVGDMPKSYFSRVTEDYKRLKTGQINLKSFIFNIVKQKKSMDNQILIEGDDLIAPKAPEGAKIIRIDEVNVNRLALLFDAQNIYIQHKNTNFWYEFPKKNFSIPIEKQVKNAIRQVMMANGEKMSNFDAFYQEYTRNNIDLSVESQQATNLIRVATSPYSVYKFAKSENIANDIKC